MDTFEQQWRKTVKAQLKASSDEQVNRLAQSIFKDNEYHTIDEIVDAMPADTFSIVSKTERTLNA